MQRVDRANAKKLGEHIKRLRLNTGKSLNSFVMENSTITTATWSRMENGITDIKLSSLLKTAALFGISVSELLEGIDFEYSFED